MSRTIAAFALLVVACGSSGGINPAFGKRWKGPAMITGVGMLPLTYDAALTVDVLGETANVFEVCPDDSGQITVTGTGNTVQWTGKYQCAPIDMGGCVVRITYTSAKATITDDGQSITVGANGDLSGCGIATGIRTSFSGT